MDRLDRIEVALERLTQRHEEEAAEIRQLLKDAQKSQEDARRMHESWLLDHDRAILEIAQGLNRLIESLRSGGNGQRPH